jgi:hypothetical protein
MTQRSRDGALLRRLAAGRATAVLSIGVAFACLNCKPREVDFAPELRPHAPSDAGSGDAIPDLQSLRITPSSDEATFDGTALDDRPVFHAMGRLPAGEQDFSDRVEWSLSRPLLGSIAGGRFESAGVGGTTEVVARAGEFSATAQLRVRLDVVRNRGLDADIVAAFDSDPARDRTAALQISYPSTDTVVPSNLTHLHYQWRAPAELDSFELRIESSNAQLRYYTTDRAWLDDVESSKFFAPSHPGDSLRIRVRALSSKTPDVVYGSDEVTVRIADLSLPGDVLYWSSTAQGIKRGNLSADHATRVVTDPSGATAATCTGCHALSRDGKRLAVADGMDRLALFAMPDGTPQTFEEPAPPNPPMPPTTKGPKAMMPAPAMPMDPAPAMPTMPMPAMPPMAAEPAPPPGMKPRPPGDYGWSSFNPDGSQLAYAAKGKLHIIDANTGVELPKVHLPPETSVTQPDWSPDAKSIAVALTMGKAPKGNKLIRGSSIAQLKFLDDGMLGEPEPLVMSTGPDDTLAFPTYSPDGRWIAFTHSSGSSKDNPTAQLWIVAADGGGAPVPLERANRPFGAAAMSSPAVANAMPTWTLGSDPKLTFLTFSSTRDYGDMLLGAQRDQLWASAIDLEALATGSDPSAAPFWLPFQDPFESNHRALWAPANAECLPSGEVCDGRDDNCDGTIDEGCCTPSPEDCSDDRDNDCDGVVNEGCACSDVDFCDNGLDEDCDQHVDEDCKD